MSKTTLENRKSVAVVVTTYNNPKSLELCLLSFQNQTFQNFEIFIADDGSKDETRDLILRLKRELPFPIYHFWHPDTGYKKAKINNTVFREIDPVKFPLIICVDHDVIVHPKFVEDHYAIHEQHDFKALMFMGRRVDLSEALTNEITPANVHEFTCGLSLKLMGSSFKGETKNVLRSMRLSGPRWLLKLLKRDRVYDLLGSNYSISTQLLRDVNGYNEDFEGYWGEDGDLFVRVRNRGVAIVGLIGYAVQWHLYHKRLEETPENLAKVRALMNNTTYTVCKNGILKLSV